MKISMAGSIVSLLIAGVVALPVPPEHIDADVDPSPGKAPETAANIEQHAEKYGTKTTTVGDLNTKEEAADLREKAIGGQRIPGKVIDETPPAVARTDDEPVSTAPTDPREGLHQGGVYSSSIQKAKATGDPDTTITFGVKGKDLPSSGSDTSAGGPNPAQAAKDRHSKRDERGIVMPHNHILYGEA